ncbi:MAG: carbohydrate binding family 9 domain-containing protein [Bacteroidia bacterium]|nr:carbohydrate binding family 9 domain-containing protein [Bacteroidia bacterium]
MKTSPAVIALIFILIGSVIHAEESIPVQRVAEGFQFDGFAGVGEWDHIAPLNMTVQTPSYHGDPTETTVIKLGYDDTYIYLSGSLYDENVDKILVSDKQRDGGDASTDWFGMVIDSYNDKQNSLGFFTTPTGNRFDAAISNDAQGRNPMNVSWNAFWDVQSNLTKDGWFVEMRIPFSSLQYQIVDGEVTMGITVWRYIGRKNEMHVCPDIPPDLGEMGLWRPSQAKEYVFEGIAVKKPFYITPYALTGYNRSNELDETETVYISDNKFVREVGLDVKYGISNNYTLDLTVNTDFAQVEVDDQQINLSRFSLFFPEKRLFFQQRAGIFDFGIGRRNNLFYSRRIGIDDDGNAIPILGGVRLTGRSGDFDVGLISMQTQKTDDLVSNNYSVFRVKKRVINENSDLGVLVTNNIDVDGNYNAAYGLDANIRIFKNDFISLKYAQTLENDLDFDLFNPNQSLFWFNYSQRPRRGFTFGGSISRLGSDFDTNLGFIDRDDYTRWGIRAQYNWFRGNDSKILSHGPRIGGVAHWDNADNKLNTVFYGINYTWNWKNGARVEIGTRLQYDNITEEFDLADVVTIPVDDYFYPSVQFQFSTPSNAPFLFMGEFQTGPFYDGEKTTISFDPTVNVSSSLKLTANFQYNNVNFNVRNQRFTSQIIRVKGLVMLSTKFSISSFIQYNSLDQLFLGNIRMRYNPREGNDLFIVYNSDLNAERGLEQPQLPFTNQQSLLVKYSYTFTL